MSLAAVLGDPARTLEYTVELHAWDPTLAQEVTLYYSTLGRETSSSDTPASTTMEPRLQDPSGLSLSLEVDQQFSGLAQAELRDLVLDNAQCGLGAGNTLDRFAALSFCGRRVRIAIGVPGADHATFSDFVVGLIAEEPVITSKIVRFRIASVLDRLEQSLKHRRHIGIETCYDILNSTTLIVPSDPRLTLSAFVVAARFRADDLPDSRVSLINKLSTTNFNYNIRVEADGTPRGIFSIDGGAQNKAVVGPDDITGATGQTLWRTVILGVHGVGVAGGGTDRWEAYLIVDDEVVDTLDGIGLIAPTDGVVQLMVKTGAITTPTLLHGMDVRVYTYMDPEDAIAALDSLPDVNDPSLVSAWLLDDNSGNTATAIGSNLDATATTAVWARSEAGQAQLAGRQQTIILGHPRNVRAEHISPVHDDWRVSDELVESQSTRFTGTFKVRGLEVASGSWDRGVEHRAGPADEPTTVDITGVVDNLPSSDHGSLRRALEELLTVRGPLTASDIDLDGLRALTNPEVGLAIYDETPVAEIVGTLIGSHGAHLRLSRSGQIIAGRLALPLSPSPRDTAVVDFSGAGTTGLAYGDRGQLAGGSWTVGAWVRVTSTEPDTYVDNVGGIFYGGRIVENQSGLNAGFAIGMAMFRRGAIFVWESGEQTVTRDEVLQPDIWHFVVVDHDFSTRGVRVWVRVWDPISQSLGTERLVHRVSLAGSSSGLGVGNLTVGGGLAVPLAGAVHHLSGWDRKLSAADRDNLPLTDLASSSDPDREFYVDAGEGSGNVLEDVSSATAALPAGARWVPDLEIDLAESDVGGYQSRALRSSNRVVVQYDRNWHPMSPADIAALVAPSDRDALISEHRRFPFSLRRPAAGEVARDLDIQTYLRQRVSARDLAKTLWRRLDQDKLFADLEVDRRGLMLDLMHEVRVRGDRFGLSNGATFRVVSTHPDASRGRNKIGMWGLRPGGG